MPRVRTRLENTAKRFQLARNDRQALSAMGSVEVFESFYSALSVDTDTPAPSAIVLSDGWRGRA